MRLLLVGEFTCELELGDGIGGTEQSIGSYTLNDCIMNCLIKRETEKPEINGVTRPASVPLDEPTTCYCESGMTGRSGTSFKSCFLE